MGKIFDIPEPAPEYKTARWWLTSDDTEAKAWRKRASEVGRSQMEAQAAADVTPRKYVQIPPARIEKPTVRGKYFTLPDDD